VSTNCRAVFLHGGKHVVIYSKIRMVSLEAGYHQIIGIYVL
jgi:hypothetical protein